MAPVSDYSSMVHFCDKTYNEACSILNRGAESQDTEYFLNSQIYHAEFSCCHPLQFIHSGKLNSENLLSSKVGPFFVVEVMGESKCHP
jgi:hypothetical protein